MEFENQDPKKSHPKATFAFRLSDSVWLLQFITYSLAPPFRALSFQTMQWQGKISTGLSKIQAIPTFHLSIISNHLFWVKSTFVIKMGLLTSAPPAILNPQGLPPSSLITLKIGINYYNIMNFRFFTLFWEEGRCFFGRSSLCLLCLKNPGNIFLSTKFYS